MTLTPISEAACRRSFTEPAAAKEVIDALNLAEAAVQSFTPNTSRLVAGIQVCASVTSQAVNTGLSSIKGCSAIELIGTAPGLTTITHTVSGGTITFFFWGPTAAGNTALTAYTFAGTLAWIAAGDE